MSALFDFKAFLIVLLLTICTCTYVKLKAPSVLSDKTGCERLLFGAIFCYSAIFPKLAVKSALPRKHTIALLALSEQILAPSTRLAPRSLRCWFSLICFTGLEDSSGNLRELVRS
jgi:Protein of unknown function (DUF1242)